jgi:hypothetical protein
MAEFRHFSLSHVLSHRELGPDGVRKQRKGRV